MFSHQELAFAQRFPFSNTAKKVLQEHSFELAKTPEEVIKRAALMISASVQQKEYRQEHLANSPDLLLQEIQAFPISKILLSSLNRFDLYTHFSELTAKSTFFYLSNDKKQREVMLELAADLETAFELEEKSDFFVRIPVLSFLKAGFREEFMKLVNQPVESGWVFLTENDFARFLSEIAREKTRSSLPVSLNSVPANLLKIAGQLKEQLVVREKKKFAFAPTGPVELEAFPPCMACIYRDLVDGKNVNHAGRFNIATFLVAIGMPAGEIVELYRKTPNFDEKISRYQVERIVGKGKARYFPSSCAKMRDYNLQQPDCPCLHEKGISHPLQAYRREHNQKKPVAP